MASNECESRRRERSPSFILWYILDVSSVEKTVVKRRGP